MQRTFRTVGTSRTVAVDDLARIRYGGDYVRSEREYKPILRRGWMVRQTLPAASGGRAPTVLTLTRGAYDGTRRYVAEPDQTLHWDLVKTEGAGA